jgi:hypothetical protein
LQKYQINKEEINYFQLSNQLEERYVSPRLEELCGHYANRLSYENLEDLVERMTGDSLLSDQGIWAIIQAKAKTYSQQICKQVQTTLESVNSSKIEVNPTVEIYSAEESEILLFDDGIQVKGQKLEREHLIESKTNNQSHDKTPVVLTDVAMLQTPKGDFEYLTAPLNIDGEEPLNLATVIRARILDLYGKATQPLNIVAITDGAKTIRLRLSSLFGDAFVLILDWYHLCKKVRNLMSMIAINKEEKSIHVRFLLSQLWFGQTNIALNYLKDKVVAKNSSVLKELIGYLEKHRSEIIDYDRRRRVGKSIGSGRIEKGVDLVVGHRQKKKGLSWGSNGSKALSLLKIAELNGHWNHLYFPSQPV